MLTITIIFVYFPDTILCYFQSWAQYQSGNGQFTANHVPAKQCTHVVYSFLLPQSGGSIKQFTDGSTLNKLQVLKQTNSKIKILAAIGGWNAGSTIFSEVM